MKTEQHTLTLMRHEYQPTTTGSPSHFDGTCSCGEWKVRDHPIGYIRDQHTQHVDEKLGAYRERR